MTEDTNDLEQITMVDPDVTDSSDDGESTDDEADQIEKLGFSEKKTKRIMVAFKNGKPKKSHQNKGFKCNSCIISYSTNKSLNIHMLNKHDLSVKCDECDQQFSEAFLLKKHYKKYHSKVFICTVCNIKKVDKTQMDYHMEAEHQADIECPQCGILCRTRTSLSAHIDRTHLEKVYK